MPAIDLTAKSVYGKFNISQLRELALASRMPSEAVSKLRSKDEALRAIDSLTARNRLALLSHRVETLSPYKHCVILESENKFTYLEVLTACKRAFSALLLNFVPLQSDATDLHPQICIDDSSSERLFIKFAHMVEVWETTPSSEDQQVRTRIPKRHVMVAEINPTTQLVSIHFPGFTQAVVGEERVTYNSFAQGIVKILKDNVSLKLAPFRLKPVTDFLLEDNDEGVVDLRRSLRFKGGGRLDLDSESDEDAASSLAQGLANTGVKISPEAIRQAFRSSEAQAIVLLWQKQGIVTRVSMRNPLPEILFIWNEVEPSLSRIDGILERLARARTFLRSDGMQDAKRYIANSPPGELIRPSWLEQNFSLTQDQALQLLLEACSSRLCGTRFRINATSFSGRNPWVSNIADIALDIKDDHGNAIETRRPEHIEVAFERLGVGNVESVRDPAAPEPTVGQVKR